MASIKIKNVTSFSRNGVVNVGIPFSKEDNIRPGDFLVVNGANGTVNQYVQWYPQGATWDNGAIKYVRAYFKTSLSSNEEKTATVTKSTTVGTQSFAVFDNSIPGLAATQFKFRISGLGGANGVTPVYHEEPFNVTFGPEQGWAIEGDGIGTFNPYWRQVYFRRLNTTDPYLSHIWVQFVIELLDGMPYANFFFRFGFFKYRPKKQNGSLFGVLSYTGLRNRDGSPVLNSQGQPVPGWVNYESETIEPSFWFHPLPEYNGVQNFNSIAAELVIEGCQSRIRAEQWKTETAEDLPSPLVGRRYGLIRPQRFVPGNPPNKGQVRFQIGASHCYKGVLCFDNSTTCQAELQNYGNVTTSSTPSNTTFNVTKVSVQPTATEVYLPSSQILAMAEDWKNFYPATNIQPPRPDYVTSDLDYFQRSSNLLATLLKAGCANTTLKTDTGGGRRQAYNHAYLGPNIDTSDAGIHGTRFYAYGLRGFPFMQTCNYYWIPLLEYNTRQESTRPNWFPGDGTAGQPIGQQIPPDTFRFGPDGNNYSLFQDGGGITALWNGTPFGSGAYRLGGYNRQAVQSDSCWAEWGKTSWGPDKEHMTNNIIILQGLITMDWFSLEYAKCHTRHWISSNRIDNANFATNAGALRSWGAPRGAGRVSQMCAFLYEITGDPELLYHMRFRISQHMAENSTSITGSTYLLSDQNTGGIEKVRCAVNLTASNMSAGLNNAWGNQRHWRPWEEGEVVLGFYVLGKCLLNKDPNDQVGLDLLKYARRVAQSIVVHGVPDFRQGTSPGDPTPRVNRYLDCTFQEAGVSDSQQILNRWNFIKAVAPLVNGAIDPNFYINNNSSVRVRGRSSGAEGRIRLLYIDGEKNFNRNLVLWLTDATGTFQNNEVIEVVNNTSITTRVYISYTLQGYKCKGTGRLIDQVNFTPLANGFGFDLTQEEEDAVARGQEGGFNETILQENQQFDPNTGNQRGDWGPAFNGGWNGFGYFRHTRYYFVYESVVAAAHAVAKEAALLNFYQNSTPYPSANATMLQKIESIVSDQQPRWDSNPSSNQYTEDYLQDINERYRCFVGYISRTFYDQGPAIVEAPPQICFSSAPTPTVTIANQQINITRTAVASTCLLDIPSAAVTIQNSTNYEARPSSLEVIVDSRREHTVSLSTIKTVSASAVSFEPVTINGLYLNSVLPGKKVFVTIIMGPQNIGTSDPVGGELGDIYTSNYYVDINGSLSSYFLLNEEFPASKTDSDFFYKES